MQLPCSRHENFFALDIIGIGDADVNRTDSGAGFVIVKTDALRAKLRIDDVNRLALRDRVVWTLWLTRAAVDAVVGNHRCHEADPPNIKRKFYSVKSEHILEDI